MNNGTPRPDVQGAKSTPIAWHTVVHKADDGADGWKEDWPLFLDLLSNRTYTWQTSPGGGHTLLKGPTETIQRFVPDSILAANGWMGVVGAATVLARGFVEGWTEVVRPHVDPHTHPTAQAKLPTHWSDFQRRFGLAIGPRCVVWTQAKDQGFQAHLPFAGVPGITPHTALGCIFLPQGTSAHAALAYRHRADAWGTGLRAFWAQTAQDTSRHGDQGAPKTHT
jgi:hypothetical protein